MSSNIHNRTYQIRIAALLFITLVYSVVFASLYEIQGMNAMPLSAVPVVLAAWWLGFHGAIFFAAVVFIVNTVVIGQTLTPNWADVIEIGGFGAVALLLIGGITGKMRDLSYQLRQELKERKRTEQELQRHRADLEKLVSARTSELEAAVQRLQQEVAEREQMQEELKRSLEKEQRLNQLKSRFTSMVSHEFRTPLTVIQSSAELLETYAVQMPEAKKADKFHTIQTQVVHMVELLDDILALDRAETVGPVYNAQSMDIAVYCRMIVDEFRPTAQNHQINMTSGADTGSVMIDERLMRRVIWNLLSNAVKYSPAGTAVEVRVTREGDQVLISVKDYGIGVPEMDRKDLFEIFHRAHNVGTIQGTGLGLSIVKQAISAHGGTIDFDSEIGVGTIFKIRLPRVTAENSSGATDSFAAGD